MNLVLLKTSACKAWIIPLHWLYTRESYRQRLMYQNFFPPTGLMWKFDLVVTAFALKEKKMDNVMGGEGAMTHFWLSFSEFCPEKTLPDLKVSVDGSSIKLELFVIIDAWSNVCFYFEILKSFLFSHTEQPLLYPLGYHKQLANPWTSRELWSHHAAVPHEG